MSGLDEKPRSKTDSHTPSNEQVTLLFIPGRGEDDPYSTLRTKGDACHIVEQSTSESLYRIETNNLSRKWSDLRMLTLSLSKITYKWYIDVTFGRERAYWSQGELHDKYAKAYLPTLGRGAYIECGDGISAGKVGQNAFLRRVKGAQDGSSSSYLYGWMDAEKHVLSMTGPDSFSISAISTSDEKPQATGRLLVFDDNGVGSTTYGALASLTFSSSSMFWDENKPTAALDQAMLAITLVFWKRLIKRFEENQWKLPYTEYRSKVQVAYAATHPIPESVTREEPPDISRLLGGGYSGTSSSRHYGFSALDSSGGGHGGGHGGADGGGGGGC